MNKNVLIGIITAVVLVGGGVAFMMSQSADDNNAATNNTSTTNQEAEVTSELASLNELLTRNENTSCTFSHTDDAGMRTNGTAYFSNQRMRVSFTTTSEQETTSGNMLRDAEAMYVWEDGKQEGFKMSLSSFEDTQQSSNNDTSSVDQDQDYNVECRSWSVDESLLTPPSDVTFTDFTAQLEQAQEATDEAREAVQNACDAITDTTARAACEAAL